MKEPDMAASACPDAAAGNAGSATLEYLGCIPGRIFWNLPPAELVEQAVARGEGELADCGALGVKTGKYTGRTPENRYIVDSPAVREKVKWSNINQPMNPEKFEALWGKALGYLNGRDVFVFDGIAGADREHSKSFRVVNELASQNLFIHQLLVRPTAEELADYGTGEYTVIAVPGLKLDPAEDGQGSDAVVALDFEGKRILIIGTGYAGEIKKAIFTTMNFVMPEEGVLPMHCSANVDPETGDSAIFFGLSGTGKTTLSADPSRNIVGDDEHGWSDTGIFNFEGGCYAKCIDLSPESEPEIYNAIRFGSIVENVVLDPETQKIDFFDASITENTRGAYPVDYIPNAAESGKAEKPHMVFFLTADAFGVLPPISKLSPEAAMYHFMSGFTSKVAGTEVGITEPVPTFSSLFGEPFMPRPADMYAHMLGERLALDNAQVYLVNTGWAGGGAADGADRIKLAYTRAMIGAALRGELREAPIKHDDVFNVDAILEVDGVPAELLDPRVYWEACGQSGEDYDAAANKLATLFENNFAAKHSDADPAIAAAGPHPKE